MVEDDFFMSDTLDNFTFQEIRSQSICATPQEISFDDSSFLTNISLDFERNSPSVDTKEVLKPANTNQNEENIQWANLDSSDLNRISSCPKFVSGGYDNICNSEKKNELQISKKTSTGEDKENSPIKKLTQFVTYSAASRLNKSVHISNEDAIVCVAGQCKNDSELNNRYELSDWGLPAAVLEKYLSRKVKNMFPWQFECLSNSKVLNKHCNLVYSAPTSAGKTLVAEILAIKTIFERQKKVIFVLPFVSIVREKMYYFQDILHSSGIRVEGFMGSYNPPGGFSSIDFAICTIEKANSLINRLLEENRLSEIGSVVVDEMHLLGDSHRGYILELLLTKLKYISLKDNSIEIQIIGMSATLPNLDQLARWLGAELYSTNFRPIPLYEQAIVCGEIYDKDLHLIRKLEPLTEIGIDTDNILQLCLETIEESCSVLIFCPSKNWCENLAQQLALAFFKIGNTPTYLGELLRFQIKMDPIIEILEQLKFCPVNLDPILKKTVSFGIGFHHAGLTVDERDIVEGGFRNGAIKILVATSTLSSGVNLPARRVLIRSPNFYGKPLDILTYRQMIGRAGRMGKDSKGESILICQKQDYKIAKDLMTGELSAVESCLEGAGKLKRAILEVIASGVASSSDDITLFSSCTLLAITNWNKKDAIVEALEYLKEHELIKVQNISNTEKYVATSLGKACLSSSIPPDEGLTLFTELEKARECFVLETELHLIYLVTPYSACNSWGNIDWMFYLDLWDKLPTAMRRVGELVGVREGYIVNASRGKIEGNKAKAYMTVHKRFFVALALQDLVNEVPLNDVCEKFSCNRGMLQSLQQSASTFAGMVTSFSRQLGWTSVELLLAQFQDRMQFGVSRDLLDLMRLPSLNGKLARTLYNGGIETVILLANSGIDSIENILCQSTPFESCKINESKFGNKQKKNLRTVWIAGKEGLTEREAANLLIKGARNYLKIEIGLKEAKWDAQTCNYTVNIDQVNNIKESSHDKILPKSTDYKETLNYTDNLSNNNLLDPALANTSSKFSDIACMDHSLPEKIISKGTKSPDILEKLINSLSLELNISDSADFIIQNRSLRNSKSDISGRDESFLLPLNDESLNKENDKSSTHSISQFEDQGSFETALQNIDISQEVRISRELNLPVFKNNARECKFNVPSKRIRTSSSSSSESSFLQATPTKKLKVADQLLRTPFVESYSKLSLENENENKDFSKLHIIDVCNTDELIDTFFDEVTNKRHISFCVVCTKVSEFKPKIGANIFTSEKDVKTHSIKHNMTYKDKHIKGFAFCWGGTESYYLTTEGIHICEIIKNLKLIFADEQRSVVMFDAKEQIKLLKQCCDIEFFCKPEDPTLADWLLDSEGKEKNLQKMAKHYYKDLNDIVDLCGPVNAGSSFSLNVDIAAEPKLRGSVEVVVIWHLIEALKKDLNIRIPRVNKVNIVSFPTSYDLEMRILLCLANVELCGMSVSKTSLEDLADLLDKQKSSVEKKGYSLAGRRFKFSSSTEVSKVIGTFKGKKVSTRKQVLQQNEHPISGLVLLWRKLDFVQRIVYPLIRFCENNRLYGSYISRTATGRIAMCDPNIQMLPKDFNSFDPTIKKDVLVSCRSAFSVPEEYTLVSADYCQLELRILTYLSKDKLLTNIMGKPGDIFRCIAAKWNNIAEEMVDETTRQNAKQICYGIIYGMGPKTLAEQLGLTTEDANNFLESFRNTYAGIKDFIKTTVDLARDNGYVETVTGRRRYLPQMNHVDCSIKSQAERQAVNTIVQGSAADIVKNAMVTIENKINLVFKKSRCKPKLTLHLHDELIYEVPEKYTEKTVKIIKRGMENSASAFGHFPVKIKTGKSWGMLSEYYQK